ncbi:MAG: protein kinase [Lentisphaeria bacterium]|jgi:serine/threonine protein kinase/formylglycine-generating enzyme required for sulfatase activity|nr:protein kinase [Lentisphaeria bacterium]
MSNVVYEPGSTISHFRLGKMLGQGGMGAVYLAEDLTLSRPVAIKFMNRELVAQQANPQLRDNIEQRFIREAKSAAVINHPNLAQIYEANFDSDTWFIAMEFIDGASIADHLENNRAYTVPQIIGIMRQTVSGLKFAWDSYKIIHRDIKPHNIMITTNDIIKIVDLGLAKPMNTTDENYDMPELTNAGVPIGTPHYMAPEQATGEASIDHRTDIFAVGATLYEVCAGRKAFPGGTAPMIYMAQIQKKYEPIESRRDDIPAELCELIYDMLEPERNERIGSYDELLERLAVIQGSGQTMHGGIEEFAAGMGGGAIDDPTMAAPMQYNTYEIDELILDRFRVLKFIGESQAGAVYHCMDTKAGVECAVKSLCPGREFPAPDMPRVKENIQRLMRMSHPNLVHLRDLIQDDSTSELFVIMELLDGRNLRSWVHEKNIELDGITVNDIQPLLTKVAEAIDSINSKFNIVHHDLKPESIYLVENDTQVRLLDHGVTYCSPEKDPHGNAKHPYKYPYSTPDYQSPEIWQKGELTQRTDQYSFAVMVYEMLGHRLPFWLKNPNYLEKAAEDKADKKLSEEERQLKNLYHDVLEKTPEPIAGVGRQENNAILRALSKDPSQRFASCTEFVQALNRKGMPILVKLGIAAAILLVLGVGAVLAVGSGDRDSSQAENSKQHRSPPPGSSSPQAADVTVAYTDNGTDVDTVPANDNGSDVDVTAHVNDSDRMTDDEHERLAAEELKRQQEEEVASQMAQFAEKQARLKEEARRKEFKQRAEQQKDSLAAIVKKTSEDPRIAVYLPEIDDVTKTAESLMEQENYELAITTYKQLIDAVHNMELRALQEKKEEAGKLREQAAATHEKAKRFEGADPNFAQAFVDADVSCTMAEEYSRKKQFDLAVTEFKKAVDKYNAIIAKGNEKYHGETGRNWTIPMVNVELVWVDKFKIWVGRYEMTNAQYRKYKPLHDSKKAEEGFSLNGDDQPVIEVTYYNCVAYCSWLNSTMARDKFLPDGYEFRLPTKEEWQSIATTGIDHHYPWGNEWPPENGNYANQEVFPENWNLAGYADKFAVTCDVKDSGRNAWDLFGLSGNVWEWTSDEREGRRGVFGGAWTSLDKSQLVVEPAGFNYADVNEPFDNIGFRIVLAPK